MSIVSGLLLVLEPGPLAPIGGRSLTAIAAGLPTDIGIDRSLDTPADADSDRWQAVLIHYANRPSGNLDVLDAADRAGRGPGFHFVIGNGRGAEDGRIQVGPRWRQQLDARHLIEGDSGRWFDQHAISICLIGDGDQDPPTAMQMQKLVELVTMLQQQFDVPTDRVLLHSRVTSNVTTTSGLLFPATAFRQQLIDPVQ